MQYHACPKCNRNLAQSGVLTLDHDGEPREYPVFQCDECLAISRTMGEPMEVALTFMVDEEGRAFHPSLESLT